MNKTMNNRDENKFIRDLFNEHLGRRFNHLALRHYNDLRARGRRRIFKTWGHAGVQKAWLGVLKDLEGTIYRGRWTAWHSPCGNEFGIKCFQEL
jgi:hypothetical protein